MKVEIKSNEILNLSDEELDKLIEGRKEKTTYEQLKDAKSEIQNANEQYGIKGKFLGVLESIGLYSLDKVLEKKNKQLRLYKNNLDNDLEIVRGIIQDGHQDIINSEKKKLAIDIRLQRKQKALEDEVLNYGQVNQQIQQVDDSISHSELEWELQESYMNQFVLKKEVEKGMAEYVLTHERNQKLKNLLQGQELDYQKLIETKYDVEQQIQEIDILLRDGVSPGQILNSMEQSYSMIEECERLKNNLLQKSFVVSDAISKIKVVASKHQVENDTLYQKKGNLVDRVKDGFALKYQMIKENY